jgi:molybdopterin synthase sulfur carrier subunit
MIQVRYFGRLREQLQTGDEEVAFSSELADVGSLVEMLRRRGEIWQTELDDRAAVLMAVNQEMADAQTPLDDGDEVAFFPPVTGGGGRRA